MPPAKGGKKVELGGPAPTPTGGGKPGRKPTIKYDIGKSFDRKAAEAWVKKQEAAEKKRASAGKKGAPAGAPAKTPAKPTTATKPRTAAKTPARPKR